MPLRQTKIPLCGVRAAGGGKERRGKERENKVRQGAREVQSVTLADGFPVYLMCVYRCPQGTEVLYCLEADVGLYMTFSWSDHRLSVRLRVCIFITTVSFFRITVCSQS